ncbi:MAG TPA: SOS response-associated peptidase [Longimicrobiales bacterium]|nr:SOS response-associated peptidase [Longimicrobiales bacterium]
MCGRYFLVSPPETLQRALGIARLPKDLRPRYNIAPLQRVPVIVSHRGERVLGLIRWGLTPAWAPSDEDAVRNINARSETVAEKPSFRDAFRLRRCLVPADGFYEWRRNTGGSRTPMAVRPATAAPIAFAGLWERWRAPGGEEVTSCVILTREAADEIRAIHDRMPVILDEAAQRVWLDPEATPEQLEALLRGEAPPLQAYAVSGLVNAVRNDLPDCLLPVDDRPEPDLFG